MREARTTLYLKPDPKEKIMHGIIYLTDRRVVFNALTIITFTHDEVLGDFLIPLEAIASLRSLEIGWDRVIQIDFRRGRYTVLAPTGHFLEKREWIGEESLYFIPYKSRRRLEVDMEGWFKAFQEAGVEAEKIQGYREGGEKISRRVSCRLHLPKGEIKEYPQASLEGMEGLLKGLEASAREGIGPQIELEGEDGSFLGIWKLDEGVFRVRIDSYHGEYLKGVLGREELLGVIEAFLLDRSLGNRRDLQRIS